MRYLFLHSEPRTGLRALLVIVLSPLNCTAICNAQSPSDVVVAFRIHGRGDKPLIVPISVFGRTLKGVVDTGSDVSLYDMEVRPLLGKLQGVTKVGTPQGEAFLELFSAPRLTVGKLAVSHDGGMVLCHDLLHLRKASKTDVRLVLGMDVLRRVVVRLDARRGLIEFFKGVPRGAERGVPITDDGSGPTVLATVEGLGKEPFLIDTGSVGTDETHCRWRRLMHLSAAGTSCDKATLWRPAS